MLKFWIKNNKQLRVFILSRQWKRTSKCRRKSHVHSNRQIYKYATKNSTEQKQVYINYTH